MNIKRLKRKERILYQAFGIVDSKRCLCEVTPSPEPGPDPEPPTGNFIVTAFNWDDLFVTDEAGFYDYLSSGGIYTDFTVDAFQRIGDTVYATVTITGEFFAINLTEPQDIIALPEELIDLSISGNTIDPVNVTLPPLPNLQALALGNMQSTSISDFTPYINTLISIDLTNLGFDIELPAFTQIESIRLADDNVTTLPEYDTLKYLTLNNIQTLAEVPFYPALEQINIGSCHDLITIPQMDTITTVTISGCELIETLPTFNGNIGFFTLQNLDGLTEVPSAPNAINVYISDMLLIEDIAAYASCTQLIIGRMDALTTVEVGTSVTSLSIRECPLFTTIVGDLDEVTALNIEDNSLTQAQLDAIATTYLANGEVRSLWDSSGQTPLAEPSPAVKTALEGGVSVCNF